MRHDRWPSRLDDRLFHFLVAHLEEISHGDEIADAVSRELLFDIRQELFLEAIRERRDRRFCEVLSFELSETLDFVVRFSPKRSDLGREKLPQPLFHTLVKVRELLLQPPSDLTHDIGSPTPTGVVETR